MHARRLRTDLEPIERAIGSVLAANVRGPDGRVALRKGTRLGERHRAELAGLDPLTLHLIDLAPGELEQDEVADRLARAVAGPGTEPVAPVQGQARVRASRRGMLRIRAEAVAGINRLAPLLLFTRPSGEFIVEADEVAGTKSAALATSGQVVREAEEIARSAPIVAVAPFVPRRIGVVMTDRLPPAGRALMAEAIRRKIEWFGSQAIATVEVPHDVATVERELRELLGARAELILLSGVNSLDPLDAAFVALSAIGGRIERTGVPAHPGSMVWVGGLLGVTVLGIATCAGFGKNTALDLLLGRVLAGEDVLAAADELGHGGLVEAATSAFPPYERVGEPAHAPAVTVA